MSDLSCNRERKTLFLNIEKDIHFKLEIALSRFSPPFLEAFR